MDSVNQSMAEPPGGVLAGEDVPRENEVDDTKETMIQDAISTLKTRGEQYREMSESEIREKAIKTLRKSGADL